MRPPGTRIWTTWSGCTGSLRLCRELELRDEPAKANTEVSEAPPADLGLISVVIPAYNEEAAIGHDLRTIFDTMDASGYTYEVLVVDDGSTDATAAIVAEYPRVRLVQHPRQPGRGRGPHHRHAPGRRRYHRDYRRRRHLS